MCVPSTRWLGRWAVGRLVGHIVTMQLSEDGGKGYRREVQPQVAQSLGGLSSPSSYRFLPFTSSDVHTTCCHVPRQPDISIMQHLVNKYLHMHRYFIFSLPFSNREHVRHRRTYLQMYTYTYIHVCHVI